MEDKSYASKDVVYRMVLNQQWVFIVVLFVCLWPHQHFEKNMDDAQTKKMCHVMHAWVCDGY
jgi:hypothetical protein